VVVSTASLEFVPMRNKLCTQDAGVGNDLLSIVLEGGVSSLLESSGNGSDGLVDKC